MTQIQGDAFLDSLDKTLSHYGVPGMKWGIRKKRGSSVSTAPKVPTDVTVKSSPGGKIQTAGGHNQMPHDDAKKAAAYRQKARASGVSSLSNSEIKALVERLRLENDYAKIRAAEIEAAKSPARKFLEKFIADERKTLMDGKKPKTQQLVEEIVKAQKGRAVKKTAGAAANVAVKAIAAK